MKAYKVYIRGDDDNCAYIGAENAGKAKYRALRTTYGRSITELAARRVPEMDDIAREGPLSGAEALDTYDCEWWGVPVRFY